MLLARLPKTSQVLSFAAYSVMHMYVGGENEWMAFDDPLTTEQLALLAEGAGISMVHMAIAFTLMHPAITAPIIGPRTIEQLETQLGAADVTLSPDVLDRIDEIVPPGTILAEFDRGYVPPSIADAQLRRRG